MEKDVLTVVNHKILMQAQEHMESIHLLAKDVLNVRVIHILS